ncbi:hypothetical protein JCM1840_002742 [Sporobolomyces johnsonii]
MSVATSSAPPAPSAFPPAPLSVSSHAHTVSPSLRPPPSSVNGHIPLYKEDFPLLHSLIDSPEYKAAVTKHPELTRRPTARRQSGSGAGGQSKRSSSSRPTKHKPPRSGGSAVNELWNKVPRALGTASAAASFAATPRPAKADLDLSVGAIRGSGADWDMVPDALETSEYGVGSSNQPPMQAMLPSAQSAPALLTSSGQGTKRLNAPRSSSISIHQPTPLLPSPSASLPPRPHLHQRAASSVPSRPVPIPQPPAINPVSRSFPDLPRCANLSFSATEPAFPSSPYPVHSAAYRPQHSTSSLALSNGRCKPSTSFNNAVSHLKRMLSYTSHRPHARSKSGRPISESSFSGASTLMGGRSRSESLHSDYVDAGIEELTNSPASYVYDALPFSARALPTQANTEANTRRPVSMVVPSSSDSCIPTEYGSLPPSFRSPISSSPSAHATPPSLPTSSLPTSSYPARRSSLPPPSPPAPRPVPTRRRPNPLQARPARPAASEIAQALEARRQLFQLLVEGPGGDVARASPVLQKTMQKARQGAKPGLGERKWTPSMPSLKGGKGLLVLGRRAIKDRSASNGGVDVTEGGRKPSSTIGTRSVATAAGAPEEAKLWHFENPYGGPASFIRTASYGATGVTLARVRSQDGYDQDVGEVVESRRPMSSYWSYGSRWVDDVGTSASGASSRWIIEEEEEERQVWSKWRKWVRERRDAVRTED